MFVDLFDSSNCHITTACLRRVVQDSKVEGAQVEQDNNLPVVEMSAPTSTSSQRPTQPTHLPKIRLVFLKYSPSFSAWLLLIR